MSTLTSNPWLLDTICYVVGGAAVLFGLVFLWRALFADRARGRRRCPKCWYDMAGVPGLRCPECGRGARNEAALGRRRRRWKAGAAWAMVAVLGVAGALTPKVSRRGFVAIVPTTVLVWWAPVVDGPSGSTTNPLYWKPTRSSPSTATAGERLEAEAWRRVLAKETWAWQSRAIVDRWLAHRGSSVEALFEIPDKGRIGKPVTVAAQATDGRYDIQARGLGTRRPHREMSLLEDLRDRQGVFSVHATRAAKGHDKVPGKMRIHEPIEVELMGVRMPLGQIDVTIDGLEDWQPLLESVDDPATTTLVQRALNPRIVVDDLGKDVVIDNRTNSQAWESIRCGVCVRLTVMLGGRRMGDGTAFTIWRSGGWNDYMVATMRWEPGGLEAVLASPEKATIQVKGDLGLAEDQYLGWPFDPMKPAWTGNFEVPLRVESVRRRER